MAQDTMASIARSSNPARSSVFASRELHVRSIYAPPDLEPGIAGRKPHVTMLHRTLIDNHCRLTLRRPTKVNRQPRD
jgi:hypothetical protein